ncbi:unnamed protein product [Didymodactylos carnosus]|uniref:Uncharacterized protein n=1 Tax=Didymodactylos carnosus TaxID=1234261 RepID=A0A814Z7H1_9BILA|nr:unnamed protein product [Didymodactylos carnosus]CAF1238597.1 unnamed protein product [Didymodactylos carnosus]CAF3744037.1 unnamed protein product [Didymodactylos carnosus]CAF4000777.1 unnamed protein product [Didymodactylos carnosus]
MFPSLVQHNLRRPHSRDDMDEFNDFMSDANVLIVGTRRKQFRSAANVNVNQNTANSHLNNRQQITTAVTTSTCALVQQSSGTNISLEAERFPQTCYPFPPFIIHFSSGNVKDQYVVDDIFKHVNDKHKYNVAVAGFGRSTNFCQPDEYNVLLFVSNICLII